MPSRSTVSTLTPNGAATPRNPTPPALWASQRYRDEAGASAVRSAPQFILVVVVTAEPPAVVPQPSTAAAA
jgi:hypothetical protein